MIYQHWDKLTKCMVGKSYPPEFYSWIKNPKARNAMEKIASETDEDYVKLSNLLRKFNVEVIRPDVSGNHEEYFNTRTNRYTKAPMAPRDVTGKFGDKLYLDTPNYLKIFYNNVKDSLWPEIEKSDDIFKLPQNILNELYTIFNLQHELSIDSDHKHIVAFEDCFIKHNIDYTINETKIITNTAGVVRVGKDLYYPGDWNHTQTEVNNFFKENYRINFYNGSGHADSCFCPVVPGLILSLKGYLEYKESFPEWEVIELPDQSWEKVRPFLDLKAKNKGKWWVPGEEGNDALTTCVETWLDNWVGYVEETVFDVNMLVIDKNNVIVNNYNKKVFDALERYGVTPHICNFRHRYFWDGGIHCITADLERESVMEDYFPERG